MARVLPFQILKDQDMRQPLIFNQNETATSIAHDTSITVTTSPPLEIGLR
jgi:hypothetical protein